MAAFVLPEPCGPEGVINNGTASLLELPKGKFIVTNEHVWDGYVETKLKHPGLRLVLMGQGICQPVDISSAELVDSDRDFDLAILRFERTDSIEGLGKTFYVPKHWPAKVASDGEEVVFAGFPGIRRRATHQYLRFESVMLSPNVESVADRKYLFRFSNPVPIVHKFSDGPDIEYAWGGMSGSMVYRLDPEDMKLDLTGFFCAAQGGLDGLFFATKALINDDGTINRS